MRKEVEVNKRILELESNKALLIEKLDKEFSSEKRKWIIKEIENIKTSLKILNWVLN